MNLSTARMVAIGALLGTTACVVFALPAIVPATLADEQPLRAMQDVRDAVNTSLFGPDMGDLVKPQWTLDDSVSTEVLSSKQVKKIEYGRSSYVTIATTSSGTYSSDGLNSPHVRYPGIERTGTVSSKGGLAELVLGKWKIINEISAGSFVSTVPFDDGTLVTSEDGNCVFTRTAAYC